MSEAINNHQFDLVYEVYKTYVNGLKAVYHRLIWKFPNHERVLFWQNRQEYWKNYSNVNLSYKSFDSIEALENEINQIRPEAILSEDFEKCLINRK